MTFDLQRLVHAAFGICAPEAGRRGRHLTFLETASRQDLVQMQEQERCADVDVWIGNAVRQIPRQFAGRPPIEMLFLDGTPKETLQYLKAAEPFLAEGAVVVADNAVIFAQGMCCFFCYDFCHSSGWKSSRLTQTSLFMAIC